MLKYGKTIYILVLQFIWTILGGFSIDSKGYA